MPFLSMMVDTDKWRDKKDRLPPRFLARDKGADFRKQEALLESLGAIEKSITSEYSQMHLVRKPDETWRLCIDLKMFMVPQSPWRPGLSRTYLSW